MATYKVTLIKTQPECNPERTVVQVETKTASDAAARKAALALIASGHKPGWASYADAELWGKPEEIKVVDIVAG